MAHLKEFIYIIILISGRLNGTYYLGDNVQDTAFIKNNVLLNQATNGPGSIETGGSKTIVSNNTLMKES